jgi:nitronate monooxygenase
MGAAGAVVGTRFKATVEYGGSQAAKAAIVASDGGNTRYDEIWDEACGLEWPNRVTGRALENRFSAEWSGRRGELRAKVASMAPFEFVTGLAQDPATEINWAGESAGMVDGIRPAAEIVGEVTREAERLLRGAAAVLG